MHLVAVGADRHDPDAVAGHILADQPPRLRVVERDLAAAVEGGLTQAVGRREPWGRAAAIAAGALNVAGGVIAMLSDTEGGIVGVVLGAIIVVLSFTATDTSPAPRQSAMG